MAIIDRPAKRLVRTLVGPAFPVWSLAFWIGGFTFYGAVVIPILHDQLGSALETGLVTQRVTDVLNLLCLVTVTLGWSRAVVERPRGDPRRTCWKSAVGLLAIIAGCLGWLFYLHRRLDDRLAGGEMAGFYPLHRVYLWVGTLQWLAGVGLLSIWSAVQKSCSTKNPGSAWPIRQTRRVQRANHPSIT